MALSTVSTLLTLAAAFAIAVPAEPSTCPAPLATIEADGTASAGSKDAVRDAFRAGLAMRVGWSIDFDQDGEPDVAHWTDAGFSTEFEGEIFAQLDDIQRQAPTRGTAAIKLPAGRQRWSAIVGTNGMLESHFDDGEPPQSLRVPPRAGGARRCAAGGRCRGALIGGEWVSAAREFADAC